MTIKPVAITDHLFRKTLKLFLITIIFDGIITLEYNSLSAQTQNQQTNTPQTPTRKKRNTIPTPPPPETNEKGDLKPDLLERLQPGVNLNLGAVLPVSKIGQYFGTGFALHVTGDANLPLPVIVDAISFRGGLELGYNSLSVSKEKGSLSLIPVLLIVKTYYQIPVTPSLPVTKLLAPYIKLGYGITRTAINIPGVDITASSFDSTLRSGLGIEFDLKTNPDIIINAGFDYTLVFETSSGSFLGFNAGATYRFNKGAEQ